MFEPAQNEQRIYDWCAHAWLAALASGGTVVCRKGGVLADLYIDKAYARSAGGSPKATSGRQRIRVRSRSRYVRPAPNPCLHLPHSGASPASCLHIMCGSCLVVAVQ